MEKEIPLSQEKSSKAARLREASRELQALPVQSPLKNEDWERITGDLPQDALIQLEGMAQGAKDRASEALESGEVQDAVDGFQTAVLLKPLDHQWALQILRVLEKAPGHGAETKTLITQLRSRTRARSPRKGLRWIVPSVVILLLGSVAVWASLTLNSGWTLSPPSAKVQGPRVLEVAFDTQGIKTNIQVAQSRLLIFPESTVAELSAWVTFPDHRVDVWEGTIAILSSDGQTLAKRDLAFRTSQQGPLDPGQGTEIFQQFDAWPWFDRITAFQVTTTRILAQEAKPKDERELPISGVEVLAAGYNLRAKVRQDQWTDRFASKVHTLELTIENSGLKPFAELQFTLFWKDSLGKTLKTVPFRPVSPFRTALPPGGNLSWSQETVFDTEVFSWSPGEEPHPVLELSHWQ